jgi:hypothetical protein
MEALVQVDGVLAGDDLVLAALAFLDHGGERNLQATPVDDEEGAEAEAETEERRRRKKAEEEEEEEDEEEDKTLESVRRSRRFHICPPIWALGRTLDPMDTIVDSGHNWGLDIGQCIMRARCVFDA